MATFASCPRDTKSFTSAAPSLDARPPSTPPRRRPACAHHRYKSTQNGYDVNLCSEERCTYIRLLVGTPGPTERVRDYFTFDLLRGLGGFPRSREHGLLYTASRALQADHPLTALAVIKGKPDPVQHTTMSPHGGASKWADAGCLARMALSMVAGVQGNRPIYVVETDQAHPDLEHWQDIRRTAWKREAVAMNAVLAMPRDHGWTGGAVAPPEMLGAEPAPEFAKAEGGAGASQGAISQRSCAL